MEMGGGLLNCESESEGNLHARCACGEVQLKLPIIIDFGGDVLHRNLFGGGGEEEPQMPRSV